MHFFVASRKLSCGDLPRWHLVPVGESLAKLERGSPYSGLAACLRRRYATGSSLPSMVNGIHSASASAHS
jgi:hypothetical protein